MEKKAAAQVQATEEAERKLARQQKDGEDTVTQLAEAQRCCQNLEAVAKGMQSAFL